MRIIAGEARGRRLATLGGEDTRPTLERVKEGMFSAVHFWLPGARVLDLFAGSGQLGLEALSRAAAHATFVDSAPEAAAVVRKNIQALGYAGKSRVLCVDARSFLARNQDRFDVVFMDPPYRKGLLLALLGAVAAHTAPGAFVLCESEPGLALPQAVGGLQLQKQYAYGTVMVSRYKKEREDV
ncbi:MAG: 16S rRNA (guanine(966)-N(2))-methyltransferase RsmD [Oscillospiraceae bacterium]